MFSLDYKRFDYKEFMTASSSATATAGNSNESDTTAVTGETKPVNIEISNINTLFPMLSNSMSSVLSQAVESAAQSKFFNSIQPKLKVHWQGPGPASVVKQMTTTRGEYVISTVGYCVYIYKLNKNTLEMDQISFHYAQVIHIYFILFYLKREV